jgi:hypothetical protein
MVLASFVARTRPLGCLPLFVLAMSAGAQVAGPYDFTVNTAASGLNAQLDLRANTAGTLIGDYSAENPTGTRTKPGLFGTFGDTENLPVGVQLSPALGGPIATAPTGAFSLDIDPDALTLGIRNYAVDFIGLAGSVDLPLTITLTTENFRTRNPSSTYPGGIPVTLPFGEASLTRFSATQVGTGGGTLTPTGPGTFDFVAIPIVQFDLTFSILGNEFTLPLVPAPFPLAGSLAFSGDSASLLSVIPIEFEDGIDLEEALPEFPLALPTVLPPGGTANVILALMLSRISAEMNGQLTTAADGLLVPAPGFAALSVVAVVGLARRRRR